MEPILVVEDLRVRFRAVSMLQAFLSRTADPYIDAVKGVSLTIQPGEIFGLVGESGSGKTTVARGVMGLVTPSGGVLHFDGQTITDLPHASFRSIRQKTAMMFQDPVGSLSPRLTVRSIIGEPFKIQGKDVNLRKETDRLLDMVNLPVSMAARHPHQLSGGQARRVGIARALALNPRLIIADEPTAGLDVSVQGEILNLMARLAEEQGVGFLMITHNLSVVRHVSDRMAVMYLGRFLEQGKTDDIFSSMKHPYTLALLSACVKPGANHRKDRIKLIGEAPSLLHRPTGCEFHTRCPFAQDICAERAPLASFASPDHFYHCHFPVN